VIVGVCYTFLAFFTRSFLETKRLVRRLDWGLEVIWPEQRFLILADYSIRLFINRFTSLSFDCPDHSATDLASLHATRSRAAAYYFIAFGCFFLGSGTHAAGIWLATPELGDGERPLSRVRGRDDPAFPWISLCASSGLRRRSSNQSFRP